MVYAVYMQQILVLNYNLRRNHNNMSEFVEIPQSLPGLTEAGKLQNSGGIIVCV